MHCRPVFTSISKPIATELSDADEVVTAWRTAGTVGVVGFNYRFRRDVVTARKSLRNGGQGTIGYGVEDGSR